ncbi:hypothetical protein HY449_02225 [Candidatus Pacearchaeota archaeon]|nr:hypothetical protein [Candidatus Pacearchaeota archaeon]
MTEEYPRTAYLKCEESGGGIFAEKLLRFKSYGGNFVAGFFSLKKLADGNLLEIKVIEETEDKLLIDLPLHDCHIFSGGKRHYVHRTQIIYKEEMKN